jgi:hypothetical protein
VLYSTNTLILNSSHMITHLPQLILPQRLKTITSLEITWPLETKFTPDQSYDNLNQDHLESILCLLSSEWLVSLRHLYVFLDEDEAWLGRSGLDAYSDIIFDHLDSFARRMTHLNECAFAIPDYLFESIHCGATTVEVEEQGGVSMYSHNNSYQQVWRDIHGNMTAVQLPYVDSYPKAPYNLPQGDDQVPGYWVLEVNTHKVPHTPLPHLQICSLGGCNGSSSYDQLDRFGSPLSPRSDLSGYSPASPQYSPVSPRFNPRSRTGSNQPSVPEMDQ